MIYCVIELVYAWTLRREERKNKMENEQQDTVEDTVNAICIQDGTCEEIPSDILEELLKEDFTIQSPNSR